MKHESLKSFRIILVVGLVAAVIAVLLTGIVKEPTITEHDFHYSVTYKLDGEVKTMDGIYRSRFTSTGKGTNPLERYYDGTYLHNPSQHATYTIAEKDGLELCLITILSDKYLMDDAERGDFNYDPYLAVMDDQGVEYADEETLGKFDAELIDWQYPEPVDNSFKFVGFSHLHDSSMLAMLAVGILVMIACMIVVKRDKTIPYGALSKIGVVFNVLIMGLVLPFITVVVLFMQIYVSGDEFIYQMDLCIPALTAFTVAASIALRRKGFTKSGFFIQFIGPALFVLMVALESAL